MILEFGNASRRERLVFRNAPVVIRTEDGGSLNFPCIALYDAETGVPLAYPAFERWYLNLSEAELMTSSSLRKKAFHICSFLNYMVHYTACDSLNELTYDDLRGFLIGFRQTENGGERDPEDWSRCISDVYGFLISYCEHNRDLLDFSYDPSRLASERIVRNPSSRQSAIVRKYGKFSVKAPVKRSRKNRLLVRGYLDVFLFECRKHDPMIALGVALQAYAGLREGEVVNLTRESASLTYGGFGTVSRIVCDLTKEAPFAATGRKTEFGSIKKYRRQEVYYDFIERVCALLNEHDDLLHHLGASDGPGAPLFLNRYGRPMSVKSYSERVKAVFYDRFLPALKEECSNEGKWAENAPFIESYEKNYPGAHMFRHWFTMYLLEKTDLSRDEISHWRGDSSPDSMIDYVHVNADMIELYKTSAYRFQKSFLGEIL